MKGPAVAIGVAAALAARPAAAAFERPPLAPEGEAMGGVLAVSPDGVFGNPAGSVSADRERSIRFRASIARPFGIPGLTESQAAVSRWRPPFALGLGARRFGSQVYRESELRIVVSGSPSSALSVGAAIRALSAGGSFEPVRSFGLDLAFRARADPVTEVGALAEAVLGEVPGDPRAEHRRTAFGIARRLGPAAILRVELQRQGRGPLAAVVGASWAPAPVLVLRAGAREDPAAVSWGFTVRAGRISVSGAAAHADPLGRTLRIGLEAVAGP